MATKMLLSKKYNICLQDEMKYSNKAQLPQVYLSFVLTLRQNM